MQPEDAEHDEEDQSRLTDPVLLRPKPFAAALHEIRQQDEAPEVNEHGDSNDAARKDQILDKMDHFRIHGIDGRAVWTTGDSAPTGAGAPASSKYLTGLLTVRRSLAKP